MEASSAPPTRSTRNTKLIGNEQAAAGVEIGVRPRTSCGEVLAICFVYTAVALFYITVLFASVGVPIIIVYYTVKGIAILLL